MTVQSDTSQSTSRRTPPPNQRPPIPASDLARPQHIVRSARFDPRHRTDELYDGDKLILPSIEGQEHPKIFQQLPLTRPNPSRSHVYPPQELPRSQFVHREDPFHESDIIDLTSPDDYRDAKRRKIANPFPDASIHHRYERIEPRNASERRYVPAMSAQLDQPAGFRMYSFAEPDEQQETAKRKPTEYGLEPIHSARTQPPVPLFHDAQATRPLEVLHRPDEIYHFSSNRNISTVAPPLRFLPSDQTRSDLAPRRTSFIPFNQDERVSVHHDRMEVLPLEREGPGSRTIYASGETSSRRQHIVDIEPLRSIRASGEAFDTSRSLRFVEPPRYRKVEKGPREIVEFTEPDGTVREYISAGHSIPTHRRAPIEIGDGERPRHPQDHVLSEISGSAARTTYRRYALSTSHQHL